ncbi:unnamed protein product [Adineta ricciae]|uniref:Uncharacterized protein n=1 Tax=Adineta ricciae TaxID=249248 RepID=A0A816HY66_ADIRI|nr:unnamed protein product [Adineta ricciae]
MTVADKVKRFFHDAGIHSTTIQYEYWNDEEHDRLMKKNENGEEMKASCLLSCLDEVCETKTCCTKESIRNEGILNTNNKNNELRTTTDADEVRIEMSKEETPRRSTSDNVENGKVNQGYHVEKF